jgi:hypothetical protein
MNDVLPETLKLVTISYVLISMAAFVGFSASILEAYSNAIKRTWHNPDPDLHSTLITCMIYILMSAFLWPLTILSIVVQYIDRKK